MYLGQSKWVRNLFSPSGSSEAPRSIKTSQLLTVFLMRILHAKNTAATKHHLVLCQGSRLIGKHVLDLTQVLCDVESPTLDPGVLLFVVHVQVVMDEVDLTQLHDLNGHVQRDGNQHLVDTDRKQLISKGKKLEVCGHEVFKKSRNEVSCTPAAR